MTKTNGYKKLLIELNGSNIHNLHLMLGSVFGGDEHNSRLIPKIVSSLHAHIDMSISESDNKRDYVFVDDIVSAILSYTKKFNSNENNYQSNSQKIICVSGVRYSNTEVLSLLSAKFQRNPDHISIKRSLDVKEKGRSLVYCKLNFEKLLGRKALSLNEIDANSIYKLKTIN